MVNQVEGMSGEETKVGSFFIFFIGGGEVDLVEGMEAGGSTRCSHRHGFAGSCAGTTGELHPSVEGAGVIGGSEFDS